jgi:hypothetical protein
MKTLRAVLLLPVLMLSHYLLEIIFSFIIDLQFLNSESPFDPLFKSSGKAFLVAWISGIVVMTINPFKNKWLILIFFSIFELLLIGFGFVVTFHPLAREGRVLGEWLGLIGVLIGNLIAIPIVWWSTLKS